MTLFDLIDIQIFTDALTVGTVGFVGGVLFPWAFRLIGYVVDSVKSIIW